MRIHTPLKKALGFGVLACVSAACPAFAVTTATTDPVGFTTLKASKKSSSAGEVNYISLDLTRPISFQGAVPANGVPSGGTGPTTITFPAGTFTAGQFSAPSYLEIGSGTNAGVVSDVISATTNTITLADSIADTVLNGNTVKVRPHWTFSTAFGVPNPLVASDLTGGTSNQDAAADILSLIDPVTNTPRDYYFNKTDGKWERLSNNADATNDIIPLYSGVQVQRRSATPASVVLVGAVKLGTTGIWINGSTVDTTNLVSNPYPLASKRLGQLGLYNGTNTSVSLAGGTATSADIVRILDPQTGIFTDFYYDDSTGNYGNRWKTGTTDASLYTIPEGAAISIVRKANLPSFVWYAPQPAMNIDGTTPGLSLLSAVSRKTHIGGGLDGSNFIGEVNLPLSGSPLGVGTESRNPDASGNFTVVLGFSNPITSGTATVNGVAATVTTSGNELAVTMSGSASNAQTLNIIASNVSDSFGQVLPSASVSIRLLKGDVNSNLTVTTADVNLTKALAGSPLTFGNFRSDINENGSFTTSDVNLIKSVAGASAP